MQKFNDLIKEQFQYGGKKYAATQTKESTDILFDDFGSGWLFGTMGKYCKRFKNLARERDILKIGCYCYILWLKKGFHVKVGGLQHDVLDTIVEVKATQFSEFLRRINDLFIDPVRMSVFDKWEAKHEVAMIDTIYYQLRMFAKKEWKDIKESDILWMYIQLYILWKRNYENAVQRDTDVPNAGPKQ